MTRDTAAWRRLGTEAALAHEAVHRAFRDHVRENEPAKYDALLRDFRAKTEKALPSSNPEFRRLLASGHERTVDTAIAFLEADPWFFRSGYEKKALIQRLKRVNLTVGQRQRLAIVVLWAIDGRWAELKHYRRLACTVWSNFLDVEIAKRMESTDEGIKRRAIWFAEAVIAAGKA